MGPIGEHSLTIAPPFYAAQADLFGPITVYAPGASRDLRGRPAKACKVWSIVFACPVTRLINCQVIELSDHTGILDGLTRLAAEVGFPKHLMVDQDSAILIGLKEAEVNLKNLQHKLYKERGIFFTTCPVGGHNYHGQVERVIRSVQNLLEDAGVKEKRFSATGYQTMLKLVENDYNSLPIGYSYDRSIDNTPLLKIITPNFFNLGRNNDRTLDGPIELPENGSQLVSRVNEVYKGIFKLWSDMYVPNLIYLPEWHKGDVDLKEGDLVYMQKEADNVLSSKWIMGVVDQVILGRDKRVRRVIVKYQNHQEDKPRLTDRSVRKLVKIYDIDEYVLQDDVAELIRRLDASDIASNILQNHATSQLSSQPILNSPAFVDSILLSGTWSEELIPGKDVNLAGSTAGKKNTEDQLRLGGDQDRVPGEDSSDVLCPSNLNLLPFPNNSLVAAILQKKPHLMDTSLHPCLVESYVLASSLDIPPCCSDYGDASEVLSCGDVLRN